jgi:radical S-adenosyl methionine domain-containing protein 2
MLTSVNFHMWEPCNMRCKFCFATFQDVKKTILPKGHLTKNEMIKVVQELAEFGFEKITFVGGEPTLCPWLKDLIVKAKEYNMTTMIVTNGYVLSDDFFVKNKGALDWITLSVDSINEVTNLSSGRAMNGKKIIDEQMYRDLVSKIHEFGYRLKINTVVNVFNKDEQLNSFIEFAKPERWKIFQTLPIKGQNDQHINDLIISDSDFLNFINKNQIISENIKVVKESNGEMLGTYAMVDPAGRFFNNINGVYEYSSSIISVGINESFHQMKYNFEGFLKRGGIYNWK